jgi:hypothetical protein
MFDDHKVWLLSRAASGTPVYNACVLQKAASSANYIWVWILIQKKNVDKVIKEVLQRRTWDPIIYNSQVHDPFDRYGCRMMHIQDSFRGKEIKNNFRQMLIMGNVLLGI